LHKSIRRKNLALHLMVLPAIILVFIFNYIPLFGIVIAFQDFVPAKGLFGDQEWVGLENFRFLFELPQTKQVIINTIVIALAKAIVGLIIPIIVALMLNSLRKQGLRSGIQTLIYLPHFISWVIISSILIDILSPSTGIINQFLMQIGIEPVYFLGEPKYFRMTLVVSDLWKEFGYGSILYYAAMQGINPELYEASDIDGANKLRKIWHITLPGIRMIIVLLGLLSLGNILNAGFDQVFNLYNIQVLETGDILDTYIYQLAFGTNLNYSLATAASLLKSIISFVLISMAYYLSYKYADYRMF